MKTTHPHPVRYPKMVAVGKDRSRLLMTLPPGQRQRAIQAEHNVLQYDTLGWEGRVDYAATISHIWESFVENRGKIYPMGQNLPDVDGLREIVIPDMAALRLPDAFYAHYGVEAGIRLDDHTAVFVDGVYFVHTSAFGDPMYLYMVVCGNGGSAIEKMSLGQLIIEKTRVAIGTVGPTQQFNQTFDDLIGDPIVCDAVKNTALKDILALTLALVSDPRAAPDLLKEVHLSSPSKSIGMKH